MALNFKSANIIQSFKSLKGNTRISIMFEPMWGVPFVMYNFYLSLYMKGLGVTDKQIGYLIALGYIFGTMFSLVAGVVTDRLGRKKALLIFDLISWPLSVVVYLISSSFWMFALAAIINSSVRIAAVSFNLILIEDAENEQRIAAYNLLNILTQATGIIIPLGGLVVNAFGIVSAERFFLAFAAVSMTIMMLLRNRYYRETSVGKHILEENKGRKLKDDLKRGLFKDTLKMLASKPSAILIMAMMVFFNIYIPIGTISSLYFAPYMTEAAGIGKSTVSILGGVYSAVLLFVFIFINPIISNYNKTINMIVGLLLQALSLLLLTIIPNNNIFIAVICVAMLAAGYSIFKPFGDSLMAEVTEGKARAGIYSLINTFICILTALAGFASGYIYELNPRFIYVLSISILMICLSVLIIFIKTGGTASGVDSEISC